MTGTAAERAVDDSIPAVPEQASGASAGAGVSLGHSPDVGPAPATAATQQRPPLPENITTEDFNDHWMGDTYSSDEGDRASSIASDYRGIAAPIGPGADAPLAVIIRIVRPAHADTGSGMSTWATIQPLDRLHPGMSLVWHPNNESPFLQDSAGSQWPIYLNAHVNASDPERFNAVRTLFPENLRPLFLRNPIGATVRDAGIQVNRYVGSDFMIETLRREYRMLGYNPNRMVPNAAVLAGGPGAVAVQRPNRMVLENTYEAWRVLGITPETRDFSDYRNPGWQPAVIYWDNRPISRIPEGQRMAFPNGFVRAFPRVHLPLQIVRGDDEQEASDSSVD